MSNLTAEDYKTLKKFRISIIVVSIISAILFLLAFAGFLVSKFSKVEEVQNIAVIVYWSVFGAGTLFAMASIILEYLLKRKCKELLDE